MIMIYDIVKFSILQTEIRIYDQMKHNVCRIPLHILIMLIFFFITKRIFFLFYYKKKRQILK